MPATYAPGPQTNAPNDTNRFWACQDPKHNMFGLNAPLPPTCWWITCGYLAVQVGHRLRKDCVKEGKTWPTELVRRWPARAALWKSPSPRPGCARPPRPTG